MLSSKTISGVLLTFLFTSCTFSLTPTSTNKNQIALANSPTPTSAARLGTQTVDSPLHKRSLEQTLGDDSKSQKVTLTAAETLSNHAYIALITYTPTPTQGLGVIADHSVINSFMLIPKSAIDQAASRKTLFMHQSTGGIIDDSGMGCLAGLHNDPANYPQECVTYAMNRSSNTWPWYDKKNLNWEMWPTPEADAIAKTDQFVDVVHSLAANYEVIGMKYCYVDGWNQSDNVSQNYYINKMLQLESQYPNKVFIWATSALWNEPGGACGGLFDSCQGISEFNQQVRAYAVTHNKPLYDIADIESHDKNGNPCTVSGYEGLCSDWYDSGGGHPNTEGAIRLAKGFWWLMARIGGWKG